MSSDRSFWSDERAVADVAELHLDEAAQVAGRDVLQVEDPEQVVAHLDQHALLESCRLNELIICRQILTDRSRTSRSSCQHSASSRLDPGMDRRNRRPWRRIKPGHSATIRCMPWELRVLQQRLERLSTQHAEAWAPAIDVYETDTAYIVTAEAARADREQIDLGLEDRRLTIRGQRSDRGRRAATSCTSTRSNAATARSRARSSSPTRSTSSTCSPTSPTAC